MVCCAALATVLLAVVAQAATNENDREYFLATSCAAAHVCYCSK